MEMRTALNNTDTLSLNPISELHVFLEQSF